jgi:hypothetical protein
MEAVVAPEPDAGMCLPAGHFAVNRTNSISAPPIFQTVGLVMFRGFDAYGR